MVPKVEPSQYKYVAKCHKIEKLDDKLELKYNPYGCNGAANGTIVAQNGEKPGKYVSQIPQNSNIE